jgi:hypothetical protein
VSDDSSRSTKRMRRVSVAPPAERRSSARELAGPRVATPHVVPLALTGVPAAAGTTWRVRAKPRNGGVALTVVARNLPVRAQVGGRFFVLWAQQGEAEDWTRLGVLRVDVEGCATLDMRLPLVALKLAVSLEPGPDATRPTSHLAGVALVTL